MTDSILQKAKALIVPLFPTVYDLDVVWQRPKDSHHGDFALSIAMSLAKKLKTAPLGIAERICQTLAEAELFAEVQVAHPGFVNVRLTQTDLTACLQTIQKSIADLHTERQSVLLEYVSANPTGPLHVGHGRAAIMGKAIARMLRAIGHDVHEEYYVNDAGTQIDTLAISVLLRAWQLKSALPFPAIAYQGDYIIAIARQCKVPELPQAVADFLQATDFNDEQAQSQLITTCKTHVDEDCYQKVRQLAVKAILNSIREDLQALGVCYDDWFSESSLVASGAVAETVATLEAKDVLYEQEGARWFRATAFDDDKDRVILRKNGEATYFLNDIAYHKHKFARSDKLINLLGADHHGYGARLQAAKHALGIEKSLNIQYIQFALLWRGKEKVSMSTRQGQFVTLRELFTEVGIGPTLFFYCLKKADQHLDFDMELAKKQSQDNPYFYVQYAHARLQQLRGKVKSQANADMTCLTDASERSICLEIKQYPQMLHDAALACEPHRLCFYLMHFASLIHHYYAKTRIGEDDNAKRQAARLLLLEASQTVIAHGLSLLGIQANEVM